MLGWCHKIHIYLLDYTKRLPAPTPQVRTEQINTGTRAEWRGEGAAGEWEKGGGLELFQY